MPTEGCQYAEQLLNVGRKMHPKDRRPEMQHALKRRTCQKMPDVMKHKGLKMQRVPEEVAAKHERRVPVSEEATCRPLHVRKIKDS